MVPFLQVSLPFRITRPPRTCRLSPNYFHLQYKYEGTFRTKLLNSEKVRCKQAAEPEEDTRDVKWEGGLCKGVYTVRGVW